MDGFVLAGGQSTRMGRDKALLELNGRALVALAVEKLQAVGLDAKICGARAEATAELARFAEVIPDHFAQSGPVAGIEAGLAVGEVALSLFLAVDIPLVPAEFLHWIMERAGTSGAAATIPIAGGVPQPLCAVYSRRLLEGLRTAIAAGHLKMMTAVEEAVAALGERVDLFQVESVASGLPAGIWPMDPPLRRWFLNANTPEEWARVSGLGWMVSELVRHAPGADQKQPTAGPSTSFGATRVRLRSG
ncbi:MAG TPA: molybdenum cofactor guanylyltransferase [Acidobacteriaceae bacterium]|nr:molybdenum cofactor guanylyltransferase [Acidobacteriaceae bacterium]